MSEFFFSLSLSSLRSILYHIMSNSHVDKGYKSRLRSAAKQGRSIDQEEDACAGAFPCVQLDHGSEAVKAAATGR